MPVAGSATPLTFVVRPAGLTMVLGSCDICVTIDVQAATLQSNLPAPWTVCVLPLLPFNTMRCETIEGCFCVWCLFYEAKILLAACLQANEKNIASKTTNK
jgi:hypothetical protein